MAEPRTHYQISLTARQAVGLFVGLLLSLGLAFSFGLMAGLSGRPAKRAAAAAAPPLEETARASVSESIPPAETAAPLPASSRASRESSPVAGNAAVPGADPTLPPTLTTFEDGSAEEAAAAQHPAPLPTAKAAGASPQSVSPAGRIWVQVASLSSRGEADALSLRLSRRGYHTQIVSDAGAKGRLRVRVGPFRTTEDARRAAEKLRKQERIQNPWVVSEAR